MKNKFIPLYENLNNRLLYTKTFSDKLKDILKHLGKIIEYDNNETGFTLDIKLQYVSVSLSITEDINELYMSITCYNDDEYHTRNNDTIDILPEFITFLEIFKIINKFKPDTYVYESAVLDKAFKDLIYPAIKNTEKERIEYWTKRINDDHNVYIKIKKFGINIPELDKKFKHLGTAFGFFDE